MSFVKIALLRRKGNSDFPAANFQALSPLKQKKAKKKHGLGTIRNRRK